MKDTILQSEDILNYNVRLQVDESGFPFLIYSCNQTRLELLEYSDMQAARDDFRLLCRVIKTVLRCEGKL